MKNLIILLMFIIVAGCKNKANKKVAMIDSIKVSNEGKIIHVLLPNIKSEATSPVIFRYAYIDKEGKNIAFDLNSYTTYRLVDQIYYTEPIEEDNLKVSNDMVYIEALGVSDYTTLNRGYVSFHVISEFENVLQKAHN